MLRLLLTIFALAGCAHADPTANHMVQFVVEETWNDKPGRLVNVELAEQIDPAFQAEEFCAIANIEDEQCAQAVTELRRRHLLAFPERYNRNETYADADDMQTTALACSLSDQHIHKQNQKVQQVGSRKPDPLLREPSHVRAWIKEAEVWFARNVAEPRDGSNAFKSRLANTSSFLPESPYDGRLAWAADRNHPVFNFPNTSTDDVGSDAFQSFTPSEVAEKLSNIALAPWTARGRITRADIAAALKADHGRACMLVQIGSSFDENTTVGDIKIMVSRRCNDANNPPPATSAAEVNCHGDYCHELPGIGMVSPLTHQEESWWRVRRRNAALRLFRDAIATMTPEELQRLARSRIEFVFCVSDCVVSASGAERMPWRYPTVYPTKNSKTRPNSKGTSKQHNNNVTFTRDANGGSEDIDADNGLPIAFSLVACAGSENIPFPIFMNRSSEGDSLEGWDSFALKMKQLAAMSPFNTRKRRAVWRGGTRGKSCWDGTPNSTVSVQTGISDERQTAVEVSPSSPALRCGRRALRRAAHAPGNGSASPLFDVSYNYLNAAAQVNYQAAIYAEGHCGWADRGRYLMLQGSVLLWQETMCREWYTLLLEPWRHYIPVDYHFSNLGAAAAWTLCPKHASSVNAMLQRLEEYANIVLKRETATAYASALLRKYSALWDNPVGGNSEDKACGTMTTDILDYCPREDVERYLERTEPFEAYFHGT